VVSITSSDLTHLNSEFLSLLWTTYYQPINDIVKVDWILAWHWNVVRAVQDHWKWRRMIDRIWLTVASSAIITIYSSILYHFQVIWHWKYSDLKIYVRGHSKSLKMAPFDAAQTSSYSSTSSILTMAISCTVFEIKQDIGQKNANCSYSIPLNLHAHLESLRFFPKNGQKVQLSEHERHRQATDKQTTDGRLMP